MTHSGRSLFWRFSPEIARESDLIKTMPKDAQIFHIDLFGRFALVTVVFFAPVLWFASDDLVTTLIVLAFVAIAEVGAYFLCTVQVGSDGIVLYRVNRARWQDVTAAMPASFLGLPYLKIQRKNGIRWQIPLYLKKPDDFRRALAASAPVGHPLRVYAESGK